MEAFQGYECQFLDPVSEDYYCKRCSLVAREITITNCCGESYCYVCLQDNPSCPGCGQENFDTFPQVKFERKILSLQVCCSKKGKGCGWCGTLEALDAHMDPDTGDCEYANVHCPLKCGAEIHKKCLNHHLASECVKRDYICPYCTFKATYEMVANLHWPECMYYPEPCPNRCGETCERPTLEDHLKICRLQPVECDFHHIGCAENFSREDEGKHMREKVHAHFTMMAAASVTANQEFQTKLEGRLSKHERELEKKLMKREEESEKKEKEFKDLLIAQETKYKEKLEAKLKVKFKFKLEEQEAEFEDKMEEQEVEFVEKLEAQGADFEEKMEAQETEFEGKLHAQEAEFKERWMALYRKAQENTAKYGELEQMVQKMEGENKTEFEKLKTVLCKRYTFIMGNFSREKEKNLVNDWKSPAMYTHNCGYKFCIGVDANGYKGKGICVDVWSMKGEYDDMLRWPVTVTLTLVLVNHFEDGGRNKEMTCTLTWLRTTKESDYISYSNNIIVLHRDLNRDPDKRTHFLKDDALHFFIRDITVHH